MVGLKLNNELCRDPADLKNFDRRFSSVFSKGLKMLISYKTYRDHLNCNQALYHLCHNKNIALRDYIEYLEVMELIFAWFEEIYQKQGLHWMNEDVERGFKTKIQALVPDSFQAWSSIRNLPSVKNISTANLLSDLVDSPFWIQHLKQNFPLSKWMDQWGSLVYNCKEILLGLNMVSTLLAFRTRFTNLDAVAAMTTADARTAFYRPREVEDGTVGLNLDSKVWNVLDEYGSHNYHQDASRKRVSIRIHSFDDHYMISFFSNSIRP
jgi:hypothetical protein